MAQGGSSQVREVPPRSAKPPAKNQASVEMPSVLMFPFLLALRNKGKTAPLLHCSCRSPCPLLPLGHCRPSWLSPSIICHVSSSPKSHCLSTGHSLYSSTPTVPSLFIRGLSLLVTSNSGSSLLDFLWSLIHDVVIHDPHCM